MNTSIINPQHFSINDDLVSRWLKFADVKPKSILTYNKAIRRLAAYLRENNIVAPTSDDIYHWRDNLKNEGKSAYTINLYLTSCKLFFKFLHQQGIYDLDISHIKGAKISPDHKRDALTSDQGKAVLNSFDTSTIAGLRNKAMTALMMTCGLRTIEVNRANVGDLVLTYGRTALFVQGKGRDQKAECVMIPPPVENLINQYLSLRGCTSNDDPLFASTSTFKKNNNQRLCTDSISRIVKSAFKSVGLDSKRLTAHSLRHTAATAMLLSGVDLLKVQQILRHKNVNTTLIYSHHLERLKNHGEDAAANSFFN